MNTWSKKCSRGVGDIRLLLTERDRERKRYPMNATHHTVLKLFMFAFFFCNSDRNGLFFQRAIL